jgi:cation transport ATPase
MTNRQGWPPKLAAAVAVIVGIFLLLAGGGHLSAILGTRAGQPFDYRFVSLLTTSGILMVPGIVGIVTSPWLWRGRSSAYVSCLLSTGALLLYLSLLIYMKAQVTAGSTAAGDEVYVVTGLALVHFVVIAAVLSRLHRGRAREPSTA